MKRHVLLVIMVLAMAFGILACEVTVTSLDGSGMTVRGSGNVVEESRTVSGFTGVELAMQGTLHIGVGDTVSLRIKAEDNLLQYIETRVSAGRLTIENQRNVNLRPTQPIHYYLSVPKLDTIVISSSGDIEAPALEAAQFSATISSSGNLKMGNLKCTSFDVGISSSGDVTMENLTADTLQVRITSSGNLDIAGGTVRQQNVTLSSSGNYTAKSLESTDAEVRLSSSGKATLRVRDRLRAILSSSGDLYYNGSPTVDVTRTSSGNVVQIGK